MDEEDLEETLEQLLDEGTEGPGEETPPALTVEEINTEYKRRFNELTETLGRNPNFNEMEPTSAWYREQHTVLIQQRTKKKPKAAVVDDEGKHFCVDCGVELDKKPGRGRWPKRCNECKEEHRG